MLYTRKVRRPLVVKKGTPAFTKSRSQGGCYNFLDSDENESASVILT